MTRRRSERGAAMVESAIIFPVIVLFLGLMEFVHAEYSAKIQSYNDARYAVWTNVVHACTGASTGQDLGNGSSSATGSQSTPDQTHQPSSITGGTQQRFLINRGPRHNVVAHIRNVDLQRIVAIGQPLHPDRIVTMSSERKSRRRAYSPPAISCLTARASVTVSGGK